MADKNDLDTMMAVLSALDGRGLSLDDQLLMLQTTWLVLAQRQRDEALAFPNGFPEALSKQIRQLEQTMAFIAGSEPDLELERLTLEGDQEGVLRLLQQRMRDAGMLGTDSADTNGGH